MSLTLTQQRLLAVHDAQRRGVDPRDGKTPIQTVENNGDNDVWATRLYDTLTGSSMRHEAWCAEEVCVSAHLAGALDIADFSMGAWALVDHLKSLGLGLDAPEPGCVVAFSDGAGHVTTNLMRDSSGIWVQGDGNYGDRYTWVTRDLEHLGDIYGLARLPGIDAELKDEPHRATKPPRPFGGHPIVQWIGHAQVWRINDAEWVSGHGFRYTKSEIPPAQVPAVAERAGQGVYRIGDVGAVRLKKIRTVPYAA